MDDIIKPVAQWISENIPWTVAIVLFVLCALFEVSKIKIYPLKWLWKLISWPFKKVDEQRTNSFKALITNLKTDLDGQMTNMVESTTANCQLLKDRFDRLEGRFDTIEAKQNETEERLDRLAAARIKNHVLNFARQCRKGEAHSHEDFVNLFKENREYEALVAKYKWENDVYKHDYAYIQRVYDQHNNNGDFLE